MPVSNKRKKKSADAIQCLAEIPNLVEYVGKWIAVIEGDVVAIGDQGKEVYEQAKSKFPSKIPLILRVPTNTVMLL